MVKAMLGIIMHLNIYIYSILMEISNSIQESLFLELIQLFS